MPPSDASVVTDDSIRGKDGIVRGDPIWQPTMPVVDRALSFDGANDHEQME